MNQLIPQCKKWMVEKPGMFSAFSIVFLHVFTYGILGWWSDSYQSLIDFAITGEFSHYFEETGDPFPEYLTGSASIFAALGRWFPVRWLAFLLAAIQAISMWVILKNVLWVTRDVQFGQKWGLLILIAAFFVESIALYHMVRVCMFAGIAGISYVLYPKITNTIFHKSMIPYVFLFAAGCWVRFNVLIFVFFLVSVVVWFHKKQWKPLVPFFLVLLFFSVQNSTFLIPNRMQNLYYYFLYDAEFKLLFSAHYKPEVRLINAQDSIKYEAIQAGFFADQKSLGPDFYNRIGIFERYSRVNFASVQYALYNFITAMRDNIHYLLADVLLLLFYLVGENKQMHRYRLKTIGLFVLFYCVVLGISFLKMENRFLVPFQLLLVLIIFYIYRPPLFFEQKQRTLLIFFLALTLPLTAYFTLKKVERAKQEHTIYADSMKRLQSWYAPHSILVLHTVLPVMPRPFQTLEAMHSYADFFMYNFRTISLSPSYNPYLKMRCNCDVEAFIPFYGYLQQQNKPVYVVDYPHRIRVLEQYARIIYNQSLQFEFDRFVQNPVEPYDQRWGYQDSLAVFRLLPEPS